MLSYGKYIESYHITSTHLFLLVVDTFISFIETLNTDQVACNVNS